MADTPPDPKEARRIWREEERLKLKQKRIDAAQTTQDAYNGPTTAEEEEAQSDWQRLIVTAQLKFPAHLAEKYKLTPNQRLAAVAYCIGWSIEKIALASGLHRNTIGKYLNQNEIVAEFIKAFQYHNGNRDSKEIVDNEQFNSLTILRELRDDPSVSASTRKEIAVWFYEQKHGKAKESKEIKGINLRDLTEQLKKATPLELFDALDESTPEKTN